MNETKKPVTVLARVLTDCLYGKIHEVISLAEKEVEVAKKTGWLDFHASAIESK